MDDRLARATERLLAGDAHQAQRLCQQVLDAEPDNSQAHFLLGQSLGRLGNLDEAVAHLERAKALQADSAEIAHVWRQARAALAHRQAQAFGGRGQHAEAQACLERVVELLPGDADALCNLGLVLVRQGRHAEAILRFRQALALRPDHFDACMYLGHALVEVDSADQAEPCFRQAVALRPNDASAHSRLASLLMSQDKPVESLASYDRALALAPGDMSVAANRGTVLLMLDRFDEAKAQYEQALNSDPNRAEIYFNLGFALEQLNRAGEALASYTRGLALKPDDAPAHHNRAMILLQLGRYSEGWDEFEWREKVPGKQSRDLPQPRWNGEPLAGRTILLRSEEGFGDTLQFIRYAAILKEAGATVLLACTAPLARLLTGCRFVDRVVSDADCPQFDFHLPLLSLPKMLHSTSGAIPREVPYIAPDPALVARWRDTLPVARGLRIGIVWRGRPGHGNDRHRSIPLVRFEPLARLPGVHLVSMQLGPARDELACVASGWPITDAADQLGDFAETAALMANLDLVISCDSAPAHLAGALGIPVWVALCFAPDWRWMLAREDSPWYPTMRLFRQTAPGDWEDVFRRVADAVRNWLKADG
jgi:tetratricopeptide (TPR) repeat protein